MGWRRDDFLERYHFRGENPRPQIIQETDMTKTIHIIGGGLAGSEAAWQAAELGVKVIIHEMREGEKRTHAHNTDVLAELVCSNSFRADDHERSAIGCLHEEMRRAGSIIMKCADANKVPAGGALAMDRDAFSADVQAAIYGHPNIEVVREEITGIPPEEWGTTIIATGPLTSGALAESILELSGQDQLAFFDAIAPIVYKESIDFSKAWYQSRYDKTTELTQNGGDYINCPMNKEQYYQFVDDLKTGEYTEFKEWEKDTPYFDACLPVEVMAERGEQTLSFGPMKPVGLTNPHSDERHYAVVQLRQDNALGTLYNMVGFQTKLKYAEQTRIFKTIPGLENAEFARLGGIHRNTYVNSPVVLDEFLRFENAPHIFLAGQISGVEGYVESASMGLLTGRFAAAQVMGEPINTPPHTTAIGALMAHITIGHVNYGEEENSKRSFQPMNINFGLFPPFEEHVKKKERKQAYCTRALEHFDEWIGG
jgi:methylenetetrahydrofolate--tRNA-(uracil-5-)-methyltransferase